MSRVRRRQHWLALLLLGLVVGAVCVRLGIWQLDRLEGRRDLNAAVARGMAASPEPVEDLLPPGAATTPLDPLRYRSAEATGTFDTTHEVIVYGRTLDGRPGNHVLTPLVLTDGRAILVDRGWVPLELDTPPVADAAPPAGTVTLIGLLLPPEERGGGPADGAVKVVSRVNLDQLAQQIVRPVLPLYLQLQEQSPAQRDLPLPARPPEPDEGPHLSYAIQWFLFAAIAVVGSVVLARREAGAVREAVGPS